MKKMNNIAKACGGIIEAFNWLIALLGVALLILPGMPIDALQNFLISQADLSELTKEASLFISSTGQINATAVRFMALALIVNCSLFAMVGRNIRLTFLAMEGKNKHVEGSGPFQQDIVRLIREIGIFMIASPLISGVINFIAQVVLKTEVFDYSVDITAIMTGVIVLCLSQVFAYGVTLQKEVEDLV